ncbi:hypothetical protein FVER53590_09860 [Fusarium verticillioides]|nr:hypothetical protein FVER53590_09860 [Fusarium verticillioides]
MLATYAATFAYASARLAATAKEGAKKATGVFPNPAGKTNTTNTTEDGLVGLWTDPNGLSFNENPSVSMYQDLSAFMGTMNIPLFWKDDETVRDTVHDVGQTLFATIERQGHPTPTDGGNPIVTINGEVPIQGGLIRACHVYYPIPMGKAGEDISLHSAIHLIYTTNVDTAATDAAQGHLSVVSPLSNQNSWVVTMNITWASAPIAGSPDVQNRFTDILTKDYSVLNLFVSNVTGTLLIVKVQAPADKTPAYAKAAVEAAVVAALNDGSSNNNGTAMNTVQVQITDSSWLPNGSAP